MKLLLRPANLLILDEPTNHLDLTSKDVLLEALERYSGTVIFVSHDRYFMDGLATKVLELRLGNTPRLFVGNYSYYLTKVADTSPNGMDSGRNRKPFSSSIPSLHPSSSRTVTPAPFPSPSPSAAPSQEQTSSYEKGKQKKAEIRKLERKLEEILTRIDTLEVEYRQLEARLALPEVYRDGEQVRRIKLELGKNESERDRLHGEWEKTEELLQTLKQNS